MKHSIFGGASGFIIKLSTLAALFFNLNAVVRAVGVLDQTFGAHGTVSTSVGSQAQAKFIAVQTDGKIIAGGDVLRNSTGRDVVLARYQPNGLPDASFGDGGKVYTTISNRDDSANAVVIQSDGKIVVVGVTQSLESPNGDFLIVRYHSNGSLDSSFGNGGVVTINQGVFNAAAVQPDGKILAAGGTTVARLNPNGSLDASFSGGLVNFNLPNYDGDRLQTIGLLPGGRIIVGGLAERFSAQPFVFIQFLVAFEPNGAIAQNFGNQGIVSNASGLIPNYPIPRKIELAVTSDGEILTTSEVALRRYRSDGSSDATFRGGFGGDNLALRADGRFVIINVGSDTKDRSGRGNAAGLYSPLGDFIGYSNNFGGTDIAAQADGKIVAVRSSADSFTVTRISAVTSQGTRVSDYEKSLLIYRPANRTLYVGEVRNDGGYQAFTTATEATRIIPEFFGSCCLFPPPKVVYWQVPNHADAPAYFRGDFQFGGGEESFQWGKSGDIPVGGDYDGDKRTDFTVYRASQGIWYINQSRFGDSLAVRWGASEDKPVPADYDYDGVTDIAVYRPSNGVWYIRRSSDNANYAVQFGAAADVPLTGDYDGDGRADFVVYRPSSGFWYQFLTTEGFKATQFGLSTDVPVPGDYDGDGKHDFAVYRSGVWYLRQSTEGFQALPFGAAGDVPVSVRYDR